MPTPPSDHIPLGRRRAFRQIRDRAGVSEMDPESLVVSMMYPLAALTLVVVSIPIFIIGWQVVKAPVRIWIPVVVFLAVMLLLHGVSDLIGPDGMLGLIYILADVGR
jgi:hypothetical protein